MPRNEWARVVADAAATFDVPGAAVGVWANGRADYACHGVTSVENPLPVDRDTLFLMGSVTKTYTATAVMRLVSDGRVELDAPVRRYVPDLRLSDEAAAGAITVLHLLNHTAGLDWRIDVDTGEGDDALAREVERLATSRLLAFPGSRASYSQAGYDLLGRVIETVTGRTYEQAISSLLLEPLELSHSFFSRDEIMTRRFAVGHNLGEDGQLRVARPWRHWRSDNPGAGLASSVSDQIAWARFHLGETSASEAGSVLPRPWVRTMQQPTVALHGSSLGDALGMGWFLKDMEGLATFGHAGSANGQFATLLMAPDPAFAVVVMSNAGPDAGLAFNRAVVRWALEHHLGVAERDPEPAPYDLARARDVAGGYENEMMRLDVVADGNGLTIACGIKPEVRRAAHAELPPGVPPAGLGLLPGDGDGFVVTSGGLKGQRGCFTRNEAGAVVGADLAGRWFVRQPAAGSRPRIQQEETEA